MPSRLSRLFSSNKRESVTDRHIEAARQLAEAFHLAAERQPAGPPAYAPNHASFDAEHALNPPDLTQGFNNLTVNSDNETALPAIADSIAHLKLLECFYHLKQQICRRNGLFGIHDRAVLQAQEKLSEQDTAKLLSKLAEKRWAVYVARAVDRFNSWSNLRFPSPGRPTIENINLLGSQGQITSRIDLRANATQSTFTPMLPGNINPYEMMQRMQSMLDNPQAFFSNEMRRHQASQAQATNATTNPTGKGQGSSMTDLPPIDILLVWHSFMLNPRAYMEDCIRKGMMQLWHQPLPLGEIVNAIDSETFAYIPSDSAIAQFLALTERNWDNTEDETYKLLPCPFCETVNQVMWTIIDEAILNDTTMPLEARIESMLSTGRGYCDQGYFSYCSSCGVRLTSDSLCVGKFNRDLTLLQRHQLPMPGTVFGLKGIPGTMINWGSDGMRARYDEHARTILLNTNGFFVHGLGLEIRDAVEAGQLKTMSGIRNMIDYKIRDRKYVIKSRAAARTKNIRPERMAMRRLMSRYWDNPGNFPLDLVGAVLRQGTFIDKMHNIDWLHSPALHNTVDRLTLKYSRFLNIIANSQRMAVPTLDVDLAWHTHQLRPRSYMVYTVNNITQFLDHDDKVPETTLHDAFTWTSEEYQRRFGEAYAECTCWYCQAVRESHTPAPSGLFKKKGQGPEQHDIDVKQHDPSNVHISSHNAVRPNDASLQQLSFSQSQRLEKAFASACHRAQQKGRPTPQREDFYWSHAYGYPVYIPAYAPFMAALLVTSSLYTVSPGCMATTAGAVGNCCSGTCSAAYSSKEGGGGGGSGGGGDGSSAGCASGSGGCSGGGGCGGGGGGGGGGCGGGGGG